MARYADRIDDLVRRIAEGARACSSISFAVGALGGYGRRTLSLHSDIDLLVVFDGRIGPAEERLVKALLHPLWDLCLIVGHQVCELSDLDRPDEGNVEFLLALLDARLIAGDAPVFEGVRERSPQPGSECARRMLDSLLSLVERRHAGFNDTLYQLEPDVKQAPGGLRDAAAARWIGTLAAGAWKDDRRFDDERLTVSEDFLLRIRSILHLERGRDANVLTHALQERVADVLGFGGATPQQRVEGLMGAYFRHARSVRRALDWSRNAARRGPARVESAPAGDNLELGRDGIRALLRPRPGLYARLSEMHDCGLLGRIFPEFERIHCRVIRDFYHKYTVDEHTLLALRNLESLLAEPDAGRARFSALLRELHAPDLLSLALLYHDVGKWRDEDHVVESVRLARTMFDRLELPREARQTVEFLIANHLQMSRVAFRRDFEDPDVIRRFASLVGTEERLKMLCLMTLADVAAVSPDTLTPWKEELLWRVYVETYNHLTLAYADELIEKSQDASSALTADRPADISETELSRFLAGLPRRYLALFDAARIYRHVRLARDIQPDHVHTLLDRKEDMWELTVVTLDKPYLFSNISGVLSYLGMDILRGQAMTTADALVLDVFQFTDQEGFLRHNPGAGAQIHRLLQDVVAGTADVTTMLRGKERSVLYRRPRRAPPIVRFDSEHSQKYTILEIIADDAVGLLYRMSRVISRHGCDVELVLISTEGETAIDVFHVAKHGAKLSEPEQLALQQGLERMLEHGHEAD